MDLDQLEAFALAENRDKALEQLIPGTEEYYFYHCLHAQHTNNPEKVEELLKLWIERYGETSRVEEIRHRRALLSATDNNADDAIDYVRHELSLHFNHRREVEDELVQHPTELDQNLIGRQILKERAFSWHSDLGGFTDAALDWLVSEELDLDRLRHLLRRLQRPNYPEVVEKVLTELKDKHSSGFTSLTIHNLLLEDQLSELAKKYPRLMKDARFVNVLITRLQPSPDVDWEQDPKEREAYLDRLWSLVKTLEPSFNSLKAHVQYHRLDFDRRRGQYREKRFTRYLRLPRQASYVPAKYLRDKENRDFVANLSQHFDTLLPPVNSDEDLVREYLAHFLLNEKDYKGFNTYVHDDYLRRLFAETKILAGIGDKERWYSLLNDPTRYQELKERVDIELALINPVYFHPNDPVTLHADIKNVETLVVKVFEINTLSYFLAHNREADTSVDLDGLVASEEQTHTYEEPKVVRVRRTFSFESLTKPGTYVVELIGNGRSSRALVRKGCLRFLERQGSAGHVFTVLDEENNVLSDATIWLGGREYKPRADGTIVIPYSTSPGRATILLRHGDLTTVEAFDHKGEHYLFSAGAYVDRESLLKRAKAEVAVRPSLTLNGVPVSLSLVEEPTLVISTTDRHGVDASQKVTDFSLESDRESKHTFPVPEDLATISFTITGKVRSMSEQRDIDLSDSTSFTINQIDVGDTIEDLHLGKTELGYVLYHLGKSGEALAGKKINLVLQHRDFSDTVDVTLQTDEAGRIVLGAMEGIVSADATSPNHVTENWQPTEDFYRYPRSVHGAEDDVIRLPYVGKHVEKMSGLLRKLSTADGRRAFSLMERRGGGYLRDCFDHLSVEDGYLQIRKLTAGDYLLWLKEHDVQVEIRITKGRTHKEWILSEKRLLETHNRKPLHISKVNVKGKEITVHLSNASKQARLHLLATRFLPAHRLLPSWGRVPPREPRSMVVAKGLSHYVSGRDIGDEYRYILERKYQKKLPGNMLGRPGLLLNPWAVRKTATDLDEASASEAYGESASRPVMSPATPEPEPQAIGGGGVGFANLDFLADPAAVLLNLKPDDNGVVRFTRGDLGSANLVRVVAIDGQTTLSREITLPEATKEHQDLRLIDALEPKGHFTEQKQVSPLTSGKALTIHDITTSKVETYDTLASVHALFMTLSENSTLGEFSFVTRWPDLDKEEKQDRYSEYACHELQLFLYFKDPTFFETVIKPYLKNKKDKTFLDHYLIGDNLKAYLKPWAYGRLNVVERILLAQRISGEPDATARHIEDRFDLIPPDIERKNHLFRTALKGSELDTEDALGFDQARSGAIEKKLAAKPKMAPMSAPPPAPMKSARRMMAKEEAKRDDGLDLSSVMGPGGGGMSEPEMMMDAFDMEEECCECEDDDFDGYAGDDLDARQEIRQFYRKLDKTEEWAENNYYKLRIHEQGPELIPVNTFWKDYAAHNHKAPFLSRHFPEATANFTEMMCALAVLDLPFSSEKHTVSYADRRMELTANSNTVVFHQEIKPSDTPSKRAPILVSQNYFRADDRYDYDGNEHCDKYVTDEFLVHTVYLCQVVLTNPTSSRQKLDLLLQIPAGALPVNNGFYTKGMHVALESYATEAIEYGFYFPAAGTYAHYPVHVAQNEELIAATEPTDLAVVQELSKVDTTSWAYVSQHGDDDQVLAFLEKNNVERLDLARIAWRMKDRAFYERVIPLLWKRHVYQEDLWSYSIKHRDLLQAPEYLQHVDWFVENCGMALPSTLLPIEPVVRHRYEHLEYAPLVNARAHRLGGKTKILNDAFSEQYRRFLDLLCYRAQLSDADALDAAYYLLLQDRVEEGLPFFDRVDSAKIATGLQHDYLGIYAAFYRGDREKARALAEQHRDHPVDRWRKLFQNALALLDEAEGAKSEVVDEEDRAQQQRKLAATQPGFDFVVENNTVTVTYQNLPDLDVRYYLMDIELLFSRHPFVQKQADRFSIIKPNRIETITLPEGRNELSFDLPAEYRSANIIVELVAEGIRKTQANYAHELRVQLIEQYGQVQVFHKKSGEPLPSVYVKVYARFNGGEVKFYKDGYTDLRGCFDYTSLSTDELDRVERFGLLVLTEDHGAVINEATPPKR